MKEIFLSKLSNEGSWVVSGPEECTWYGITCDADEQLVSIELRSVSLRGPIPTDWGVLLPHLRTLEVTDTELNGTLPSFLYSSPTLGKTTHYISVYVKSLGYSCLFCVWYFLCIHVISLAVSTLACCSCNSHTEPRDK
jgi:hypothetical protein